MMGQLNNNLNSEFSDYIQDKPTISYVQPTDPWLVQKFISGVEILFGRKNLSPSTMT